MYYILKNKVPVKVDLLEWAQWFENFPDRHVGLNNLGDEVHISTVFLGLDYSFTSRRSPILFETMIFGGEHNEFQQRYHSWEEAEEAHEEIVLSVRKERIIFFHWELITGIAKCIVAMTLTVLGLILFL